MMKATKGSFDTCFIFYLSVGNFARSIKIKWATGLLIEVDKSLCIKKINNNWMLSMK